MAFLKYRTSTIVVAGLIILALLGIFTKFTTNPAEFIQNIFVFAVIGLIIFFVVRKFSNSSPQKREQRAFLKAAKRSKKRLQHKGGETNIKGSALGTLSTLKKTKAKKKPPAHLTVIDGKKGKKKNRASF
ncbi:SA1362 family protein [Neobacillus niacini]|uniref:SA1362 family protein n=1 Tax=Neobacillus niacini TaxID=86668 RepID=UPI002889037F|nr:SA1362 family protein [Neobacillus niacini]